MDNKLKIIARIHNDFSSKFGIPRQSGIADEMESVIVFEPEFRNPDALRGIEEFDRLWLIWQFSENTSEKWQPTVRPPKLGGNKKMGVFATRSPFRPNPLGLSNVKLIALEQTHNKGTVIRVGGADLMNGTPIYDIKPYVPYADAYPEAKGGFALDSEAAALEIRFPDELLPIIPESKRKPLMIILSQDPRPGYQHSPERIYGVEFAGFDIRFKVENNTLTVTEVVEK